jgi:hypothetical protein
VFIVTGFFSLPVDINFLNEKLDLFPRIVFLYFYMYHNFSIFLLHFLLPDQLTFLTKVDTSLKGDPSPIFRVVIWYGSLIKQLSWFWFGLINFAHEMSTFILHGNLGMGLMWNEQQKTEITIIGESEVFTESQRLCMGPFISFRQKV